MAKQREVVLLFLDLSRAFNFVNIDTLLKNEDKHGFRQNFSEWVKSCQSNREQLIEIRDRTQCIKSSSSTAGNGVPQGSVLGPSFFSMYTNDLSQFFYRKAKCIIYLGIAGRKFPYHWKT